MNTPRSAMIGGAGIWTPKATILGSASKIFDQLIKSLFANNEQGFAYDPNDLTTLYQDAAGTVPVTGVGQPVGLMLDKSKGLVLGNELSNYSAGFNSLVGISPVGATLSLEGTALVITAQAGTSRRAEIPISGLTVGKFYKIKFIARKNEIGIYQNFQQFTPFNKISYLVNVLSTTATEYTFIMEATAVSGVLRAYATSIESVDAQIIVESVSVKEVKGNHAYQTTSASRPILRQNAITGAYYLEFDGYDDFLVTNSIDFTATDKVSLFAGVRKLSDAYVSAIAEFSVNTNNNAGSFWLISPLSANANSVSFASRGSAPTVASIGSLSAPASAVLRGVGDISGDNVSVYTNANLRDKRVTDQGAGNYGNYPLYIGRRGGTTFPFNGHIYSLTGVGRLTTESETTAIEKELAKRTGVTLNV